MKEATIIVLAIVAMGCCLPLIFGEPELIPAPREAEKVIDIVGHYAVEGVSHKGKTYLGTVLIAAAGENYSLTWVLEDGGIYRGIGLRERDTLTVGAVTDERVCAFRFQIQQSRDGRPCLIGKYAMGEKQGSETLSLIRRPSL